MALSENLERYIESCREEIRQLIRDLCAIPAPSHHEEARAAFCKAWFERNGGQGVYIDEALNVICPWGDTGDNDLAVLMAHTDTVFPDTTPMPFREEGDVMYCPGVTDDTANLAVLMICARYIMENRLPVKTGLLFVANSCEEGMGNLKGSRAVVKRYGSRMRELITLDGTDLVSIVTRAVGSHRYRVTARTDGGHSFRDFGNRNAIEVLAGLVEALYRVEVPRRGDSHTTYNVGVISGGTSVNTIAQNAEMLYEYRSDSRDCLASMQDTFEEILRRCVPPDAEVAVELIGERPCAGDVDGNAMEDLIRRGSDAVRAVTGREAALTAGSTDCNIPLSAGIPAVCLGVCVGGKCHTREEWLDASSLEDGCRLFMEFLISSYLA